MPDNEPIRQPVEVTGADAAQRELNELARSMNRLGDETEDAGRKADRAADNNRELGQASEQAEGGVSFLVGGLRGFAASALAAVTAGIGVVEVFRNIATAAGRASEAVADLGDQNRGLAANVGGFNADALIRSANEAALSNSLGPAGRDSLIAAATSLTDRRSDLSQDEVAQRIGQIAQLRRATGVGGTEAVELLQSFESRLGISGQDAIDQATGLLNSGIEPGTLGGIIERAGEATGPELLDLLFAVRDQVNLQTSGEAIGSVLGAVSRRDSSGRLDPSLVALGAIDGQSPLDTIRAIGQAFESGQINQGQFQQALGGTEGLRIGPALARELAAGLDDDRAARLSVTAAGTVANIASSGFVRAADRRNSRELREAIALETSRLADPAEAVSEFVADRTEEGGGSFALGLVAPGAFVEDDAQREAIRSRIERTNVARRLRQAGVSMGFEGELASELPFEIPERPVTVIQNYYNGTVMLGRDIPSDMDEAEGRGHLVNY